MEKITNFLKENLDDVFFITGGLFIVLSAFIISIALGLFILGAFFMVLSYLVSR